ncbi:MAG: Fic family protein [Bacteroidaceae bacterium]|nr:Fic family protein [Bacteroidaceae bacterium]
METANHCRCIDMIIDRAVEKLTEALIKELHSLLKSGTAYSRKDWFAVGNYKKLPNEVGGQQTTLPEHVPDEMKSLLRNYNAKQTVTFDDILDLHHRFETIHPFQDGNGRVGRLLMFKECLAHGLVPFIITDEHKMFYYRGLQNWGHINGYLRDTCLAAQDDFKALMEYFRIPQ